MTCVKICGITELDHALLALEAGADMLGFVFAPSRRRITPERAAEMVARCRERFPPSQRPWQAVGVFANQPMDFVQWVAAQCGLDVVQLSGREAPDYCRELPLPLYRAVHLPDARGPALRGEGGRGDGPGGRGQAPALREGEDILQMLHRIKDECGTTRLLLDSGGTGRWGGTGQAFHWEWIGESARECIVAGGLTPRNVAEAIALMRPWGVDVSSGVETQGTKDPELIRRFIAEAKRSR